MWYERMYQLGRGSSRYPGAAGGPRRMPVAAAAGDASGPPGRPAELGEETLEVRGLVVGVEPARVGQDPHGGGADGVRLSPEPGPRAAEGDAVRADAEEGDDARPVSPHLGGEAPPALDQLGRGQLVRRRGGPGDHVGDPVAERQERPLVVRRDDLVGEAAGVQGRPEAV